MKRLLVVALATLPLLAWLPLLSHAQTSFSIGSSSPSGENASATWNWSGSHPANQEQETFEYALLSSDDTGVLIAFSIPGPVERLVEVEEVDFLVYDIAGLPGKLSSPGLPELPAWSELIALPPGSDAVARILEVETKVISLSGPVLLASDLGSDLDGGERSLQAADLRRPDGFFPSDLVSLGEPAYIRDQRVASISFYPLRVDLARNSLEIASRLLVRVDFVGGDPGRSSATAADSTSFETLFPGALLNPAQAGAWRALPPDYRAPEPGLPGGVPVFKIEVDTDGLYQVTYDDLLAAGMDVTHTNPLSFALSSQGNPVAFEWFGGADDDQFTPGEGLRFFGQRFRGSVVEEKYTDTNVYWLSSQGAGGPRVSTADGTPAGAPAADSYRATIHREEDYLWHPLVTTSLGEQDVWYWLSFKPTPVSPTGSFTIPISLTAVASEDYSATIRLAQLSGCGVGVRHVRVLFNGLPVDEQSWGDAANSGCFVKLLSGTVPGSEILQDGADVITWAIDSTTTRGEFLNWFEVEYQRQFLALEDELFFGGDVSGTWTYTITGWTTNTVAIWDVTRPLTPTLIESTAISGGGPYALAFESDHPAGTQFIAVGAGAVRSPLAVGRYVPPDLDPPAGADWIAITHRDFITAAQRLADYRTSRGMRTAVVDVDDLYNQYAYGIYQPSAIHDFLAHALGWPSPAPAYTLLVGDGNWNFEGLDDSNGCTRCAPEPIYIPPYLAVVDPWQGEVPADNLYALLVGDDAMPDIALGRLPVHTITQTERLVDEIIEHETGLLAREPWQNDVVLVADKYDASNFYDFAAMSDLIAARIPGGYDLDKIYYMVTPYTSTLAMTRAITESFNQGAVIVTYRGHGGYDKWGGFFRVGAEAFITNVGHLPVVVTADCHDVYFALPRLDEQAISETLLRHSAGGAVGYWGAAGMGIPSDHSVLHQAFFESLFHNGRTRFGDAALAAKLALFTLHNQNHNLHTFTLLGDPAMIVIPVHLYLPLVTSGGD